VQDSEHLGLPQGVVAAHELLRDGHQVDGHRGGAKGHHGNLRYVWTRWLLVPCKKYQWPKSSCIITWLGYSNLITTRQDISD
jgi:hypothetical protein